MLQCRSMQAKQSRQYSPPQPSRQWLNCITFERFDVSLGAKVPKASIVVLTTARIGE